MSKIGRNDACPCGSGKKFKNCHLGKENELPVTTTMKRLSFDSLIKSYKCMPILNLIGALQLDASNHDKTLRLEQMARKCLLEMGKSVSKPNTAYWDQLKEGIEGYFDNISMEEEPTAAFTENVVFSEGNYIVYPGGVYVTATRILNDLLETIFLTKNELPEKFKKQVYDGSGLLLFLSKLVAKELQHVRYMYSRSKKDNVVVPEYDKALEYVDAITFTKEQVAKICELHGYDEAIIKEFIISPKDPELKNEDPDHNLVNKKPLILDGEDIVLYMPTSVVSAVREFIYDKAKEYNCYNDLLTHLLARQYDKCSDALRNMGWLALNIELPEDTSQLPIQEDIFQLDNQKIAYLCFISKRTSKPAVTVKKPATAASPFADRMTDVITHLKSQDSLQNFQVLSLFIISEIGDDILFAWPKASDDNFTLTLSYSNLDAIAYSDSADILTLWKFAKIYGRTSNLFRIESFGGSLDSYVAFKDNDGSFCDSERENPIGGSLFIPVGYSNNFLREIHKKRDEHATRIFYNSQLAYTKGIRFKEYAPIYVEKEPLVLDRGKVSRLVIETYKMPIWITNYNSSSKNSFVAILSEGIAFWLQKLKDHLSPILNALSFVQFEIEVIADEITELRGVDDDDKIEKIEIKIEAPRIQLYIPSTFMHLVRRPDNLADKHLMKAVLNGFIEYVKEAKETVIMDEETISKAIEDVLKPSNAKMFLFSDAGVNLRLDERGLTSLRYIPEADSSYVLDNLVSYLPTDYKIPNPIKTREEKLQLCNKVVEGLIGQICKKIEVFNAADLLEWLIKLNEKCIQVKEFREITIPTKIACFSDFESEVNKLFEKNSDQVALGQALRTLIEWVAANPPSGSRWPNFDEIDELLALVNQVISWGSEGDAIWTKLDDPEMGLLPSGRIGSEKTFQRTILSPFSFSKTTSEVFEYVENWESAYTPKQGNKKSDFDADRHEQLSIAFNSETGISLFKLSQIIWVLAQEAFKSGIACTKITEPDLYELVKSNIEDISNDEIKIAVSYLCLERRTSIGEPQSGYQREEIYPWRHKRALSYLRRPFVRIEKDNDIIIYFGYRHLVAFLDNLHYLLYEGKYPNPKSKELRTWLGTMGSDKGNPFRDKVKKWFEGETGFEVIPIQIKISKNGHLKANRDYGDIDLLVIDHADKIIYPIECKNITGGRTIYEMWSEISGYLGRYKDDQKAKIIKHLNRDEWLKAHKESLSAFVSDPSSYEINSIVMTPDEIPLAYLKKHHVPLPIKSFSFLKRMGTKILK